MRVSEWVMVHLKFSAGIVATSLVAVAVAVPTAGAVVLDSTDISISVPNAGLGGFTGPYANLHIDRTSTTSANIIFTSLIPMGLPTRRPRSALA
jgi:hypothetical protein